ncbi:hypothetical protein Nepgr_003695 [Nepenthes gracilis]|uniref:NAC domain-containing protein n=1 Tax=Nepenthes gracilis TaxID=150966 RepID=A0AAD3RZZ3_NEPGR|nr:hypothetical protein Nepgr_003695 [Nepenthes gracilis]
MAGARASWLVDGNRFATKIKSASGASDPAKINWKSNPTRACPNCQRTIDNSDVTQEWPGLPRGVKFDPSDQEIILHLLAKLCIGDLKPHPFIDEFIPTVDEDDGICYTHPRNLPGVKQDGSASHFFHRAIKAYNTGTRKRRKIHGDDSGDVRWHKTGRTKPVILDAVQRGCKKIMVLYASTMRGGKPEKTNWVMHQYHLGTEEDEKDGELVVSKVFYQQQQIKQNDKNVDDNRDGFDDVTLKVDPVTPKSVTPEPPCVGWRASIDSTTEPTKTCMDFIGQDYEQGSGDDVQTKLGKPDHEDEPEIENHDRINGDQAGDDPKWWDSESQYLLDSQQLVEGLSLCEDLLQSQSPSRDGNDNDASKRGKPGLSDYAHLGPEHLKKDLEECQNLVFDPANIELDTPPDFRLSQLEFGSQESFLAWGGSKVAD